MTIKKCLLDRRCSTGILAVFFVLERSEPHGLTWNTGTNACATSLRAATISNRPQTAP